MNAWSHLPNACHIDRIIESVKSHPEIWGAASDAISDATRDATRDATLDAADRGVTIIEARRSAWDAAVALIAYDDASKYLEMPVDQLRFWAILSEDPAAVLLLPAVVAFERINELECV
jgi:hypothetical protein